MTYFWLRILILAILLSGCSTPLPRSLEDRQTYVASHASLETKIKKAIIAGHVVSGMTRDDVDATWGSPSEVDTSEAIGLHLQYGTEVWTYNEFLLNPEAEVTFKNGKVVDVSPQYY